MYCVLTDLHILIRLDKFLSRYVQIYVTEKNWRMDAEDCSVAEISRIVCSPTNGDFPQYLILML